MAGTIKSIRNFESTLRVGGILTKGAGRILGMKVINKTGSDIAINKLVAISGFDVTTKLPKVVLANAATADLATDVFVTLAVLHNGVQGNVWKGGTSTAVLNTNFGTVGDPVYLDITSGGFTGTMPTAANARVQIVGYTLVKSATVGQIRWDIKGSASKIGINDINQAYGRSVAVTAAVASVATITPAADASFDVCMNILVTTSTTHTFTGQCTYTDEGNTGRTVTMPFRLVGDTTALTATIAQGSAVPYNGVPLRIRVKGGTAVTLLTSAAGTYTTVTYNVEGTIRQAA